MKKVCSTLILQNSKTFFYKIKMISTAQLQLDNKKGFMYYQEMKIHSWKNKTSL